MTLLTPAELAATLRVGRSAHRGSANLCESDQKMNPLTAVFAAMQSLDPKPGAQFVVSSACDKSRADADLAEGKS